MSNTSSAILSMEPFLAISQYFAALPVNPVFSTVHFLLTAVALRSEPGGVQFAQLHPIASCVMTFIVANSGGILANLALGTPLVQCIVSMEVVASCVLAWYVIFFSPFDICYALCHFWLINRFMWVIKELYRAKKMYNGVSMAAAVYPDSLLAVTVVAMFKGSGKQWGITWYHLVFNRQSACKHELLGISYVTKSAFLFSFLLAYNHTHSLMDPALLVLLGGCVMVGVKLWSLQVRSVDPFMTPQGYTWQLLTCLSVTHPHREVGIMAKEKERVNVDVGSQDKKSAKECPEKHLKHD